METKGIIVLESKLKDKLKKYIGKKAINLDLPEKVGEIVEIQVFTLDEELKVTYLLEITDKENYKAIISSPEAETVIMLDGNK